jgi:hypothetical protein
MSKSITVRVCFCILRLQEPEYERLRINKLRYYQYYRNIAKSHCFYTRDTDSVYADRWPKKYIYIYIRGILNLQSKVRETDEGGAGGMFLSPIYALL